MKALGRLRSWLFQLLVALDQLLFVWIAGWFFVWGDRGGCPNARETISSSVGRHAVHGRAWALFCEVWINKLFLIVAKQHDHCRRSMRWDRVKGSLAAPLPLSFEGLSVVEPANHVASGAEGGPVVLEVAGLGGVGNDPEARESVADVRNA